MNFDKPLEAVNLRRRAEDRLQQPGRRPDEPLLATDPVRLLHELQVYQIELEMQNEELRTSGQALEVALAGSEARWKFALESAGDGVWDWDVVNNTAFFSPRYREMLGYAARDFGGLPSDWSLRVHPGDLPGVQAILQAHLDGQTPTYVSEYRMRCKDHRYKWILARGLVVTRDAQGKALRMVGTNSDITQSRSLEADLRVAAVAFESQQAMFILNADKEMVRVNRAFTKLLNYEADEVLGRRMPPLVPFDLFDQQARDLAWACVNRTGETSGELPMRRRTGELITLSYTLAGVQNEQSQVTHYVVTLTDITDRKRLQAQRQQDALDQRNALIREVHHRVKNNLQGVMGILLEFGRHHPETAEPIAQVVGQVKSIAVIHGLQGRSTRDEVRLCELTTAVAANVAALWQVSIEVRVPDLWVPRRIASAEAVPLALVLNELILNAVKHGGKLAGHVQVTLQAGDTADVVRLSIVNAGEWRPQPSDAQVGLQLVQALMPRKGAKLTRDWQDASVKTTLVLQPPVISLETTEPLT